MVEFASIFFKIVAGRKARNLNKVPRAKSARTVTIIIEHTAVSSYFCSITMRPSGKLEFTQSRGGEMNAL